MKRAACQKARGLSRVPSFFRPRLCIGYEFEGSSAALLGTRLCERAEVRGYWRPEIGGHGLVHASTILYLLGKRAQKASPSIGMSEMLPQPVRCQTGLLYTGSRYHDPDYSSYRIRPLFSFSS